MSQENLDVVRRAIDAQERGDDTMLADFDPGIEFFEDPRVPGATPHRGLSEVKKYFDSLPKYWKTLSVEVERLVDIGDDVLVLARLTAQARHGGPELDRSFDQLWTLHDGKVVRIRWFSDRAEALEAVGLPEPPLPEQNT